MNEKTNCWTADILKEMADEDFNINKLRTKDFLLHADDGGQYNKYTFKRRAIGRRAKYFVPNEEVIITSAEREWLGAAPPEMAFSAISDDDILNYVNRAGKATVKYEACITVN